MHLIDTHVHINFPEYREDLAQVGERWRSEGVIGLVHSCVTPADFPSMQSLADRFPEMKLSVGLHPLNVNAQGLGDLETTIRTTAQSDGRITAIGETGLDFYKADNPAEQITAFQTQLHIAQELNLPVIIHCREAAQDTYQVLKEFPRVRGVMHCWAGTPAETELFLNLGMYISFSGILTFKNAKQIHASCQMVPIDRLLIETDCPFLAPTPHRGKRNEPAMVKYVAEKVASLRQMDISEVAHYTTRNAMELFNLDGEL
jgi:TatD DNase family protein